MQQHFLVGQVLGHPLPARQFSLVVKVLQGKVMLVEPTRFHLPRILLVVEVEPEQ
jgi:hypothetical protein